MFRLYPGLQARIVSGHWPQKEGTDESVPSDVYAITTAVTNRASPEDVTITTRASGS